MYRTCISCTADLGTNEVVETFPIGNRLAFDPRKKILWVICRKCGRWNLSPLEERSTAIEEAETCFSQTQLRFQGDSLGIASLSDGTELLRVGQASQGMLAEWRYGTSLHKRRWAQRLESAAEFANRYGFGLASAGLVLPAVAGALPLMGGLATAAAIGILCRIPDIVASRRRGIRLVLSDDSQRGISGEPLAIRVIDTVGARLVLDASGQPAVWIDSAILDSIRRSSRWLFGIEPMRQSATIYGEPARNLLTRLSINMNKEGAPPERLKQALGLWESEGGSEKFVMRLAAEGWGVGGLRERRVKNAPPLMPPLKSLALEIALNEERERLALEGELRALTSAWHEAEVITRISDSLLELPHR